MYGMRRTCSRYKGSTNPACIRVLSFGPLSNRPIEYIVAMRLRRAVDLAVVLVNAGKMQNDAEVLLFSIMP